MKILKKERKDLKNMKKLVVKRRLKKTEGYENIFYCDTPEEAIKFIKTYKTFHNPYDIYFTIN